MCVLVSGASVAGPVLAYWLDRYGFTVTAVERAVDIGLGRTGSVGNDGSGEIFLAFSTAHRIPRAAPDGLLPIQVLVEGQFWTQGSPFDLIFDAVAEASEEAALNALCQADTVEGRDGHVLYGFPIQRALDEMRIAS